MSDVGLFPPGAMVLLATLGLLALAAIGGLVSLLAAWLGTRRSDASILANRFFGFAVGAGFTAVAAGFAMTMIDRSPAFGRWVDQPIAGASFMAVLVAIWPAAGYTWKRAFAR
ncbi:MAG: hypothetical protein H0T92_20550 [Pyrinomonadaceae bacterium]|nr:hypothetical protein [Pyrinomonadaceae bacterium]